MNVSRAILENMATDQKALDDEIAATTDKLAALVRQRAENDAHLQLARSFLTTGGK